jgi:hypothetical protein
MLRRRDVLACCTVAMLAAPAVEAQSGRGFLFREPRLVVTAFGGFALANAGSDLFDFTTDELTLSRGDFGGRDFGGDLAFRIADRYELVLAASSAQSRKRSEFREWEDNNGQPIEQVTKFQRVPISVSLRYHPLARGRQVGSFAWIPARIDPWVGAGVGKMRYSFRQVGDFIDFETDPDNPAVFTDDFRSEGWANLLQASAGAGWSLTPRVLLTGELRYMHSSAELGGDFVGFDKLDLSGLATTLGLSFRL